jgi:RHS repeat-associated protein
VLGRPVADAVSTLGTGVEGTVRRMETAYDGQGNGYLFTNYDAAASGNVVNQVQRTFNGLGQLTTEYQEHSGSVNTGTSLNVQYGYSFVSTSGGPNHSRLTSMTYPDGRVLNFNYSSGLDANISRISSISDTSATLEAYTYVGLGTDIKRAHAQPGVDLTYIKQTGESNGDAGDQYTGLDRFGRVVDQRWIKTSAGTATDRYQYGYDRDGNPLYRDNLVNTAFGELYHADGSSNGYDQLNQLSAFARGTLNASKDSISGTTSRSQSWTLDALGNFSSVTTDGTGQTRTHNQQNEVTGVGSNTLTFDADGNMTTDETGRQFVFDAWSRLAQVKDSNGSTLETLRSDALGRRVSEAAAGTTRDLYHSSAWQVLEERVGGQAVVQHVWSPVYVDAMVERDRDADGNSANGREERLYAQQDANFNLTALVTTSGAVVERFVYDPYGVQSVLDASWVTQTGGSLYAWLYAYQGLRYDSLSGLYHARARDVSASLARWMSRDPLEFAAGDSNLYRFEGNGPTNGRDPSGLREPPDFTQVQRALNRAQAERDAAIRAKYERVARMIDDMKNLSAEEKALVKQAIQQLLTAALFKWSGRVGPFGQCTEWADEYDKRTRELQTRLEKQMKKYFKITRMFWNTEMPFWLFLMSAAAGGHPAEAWAEIDPGHAAIKITFRDGSEIYIDDGWIGGDAHVFFKEDIPSRFKPTKGYPLPVKFED